MGVLLSQSAPGQSRCARTTGDAPVTRDANPSELRQKFPYRASGFVLCLAFLGAGPRRDVGSGKRGAGVEERSVQETAGKRSGYGDLSAAAGLFLKPQLLLDGMRALVALSAKR